MSDPVARHVGLLSLEGWDSVWRRNQHLASQLIEQRIVERLTFVEPAAWAPSEIGHPAWAVTTVRPRLIVPKRAGGLRLLAAALRRGPLADIDLLWINDAPLGRWLGRSGRSGPRSFYDVTDDWRESDSRARVRRRLIAAEDWLSTRTATVVCSKELARRWRQRYGVEATVVPNGVDLRLWKDVAPAALPGPSPHVGYVGTLHIERLDVDLVIQVAQSPAVGSVHLVGPDVLDQTSRDRLDAAGVRRTGAVPHADVPAWMSAFDILICPHLVTPFTLSLDAIKAYEYAAADRPVVATPTSGFQDIASDEWAATARSDFVSKMTAMLATGARAGRLPRPTGWDERAMALGQILGSLTGAGPGP